MKFWTGFFAGILFCIVLLVGYSMWMMNTLEEGLTPYDKPELYLPGPVEKADFNLQLRELHTDSLLDTAVFRNKVVLLNFWEFWCQPCKKEMPGLERLYNTVKDSSVVFAFITTDRPDSVRNSAEVKRHRLPNFYSKTVLPVVYQGEMVPRTYIINRKGEVLVSEFGGRKWDYPEVVRFIDSLKKI